MLSNIISSVNVFLDVGYLLIKFAKIIVGVHMVFIKLDGLQEVVLSVVHPRY